jgi:hypothetical protein
MSSTPASSYAHLPGGEFVADGLADLAAGRASIPALVLAIASERLRAAGLPLPAPLPRDPEIQLFRSLRTLHGDGAHSQYNACLRRLASLCHALETSPRQAASGPAE